MWYARSTNLSNISDYFGESSATVYGEMVDGDSDKFWLLL